MSSLNVKLKIFFRKLFLSVFEFLLFVLFLYFGFPFQDFIVGAFLPYTSNLSFLSNSFQSFDFQSFPFHFLFLIRNYCFFLV